MKCLIVLGIAWIKVFFTKIFMVFGILGGIWIKGEKFHKSEKAWKEYFNRLTSKEIMTGLGILYGISAVMSSMVGYWLLLKAKIKNSRSISVVIFLTGAVLTISRFYKEDGKQLLEESLEKVRERREARGQGNY